MSASLASLQYKDDFAAELAATIIELSAPCSTCGKKCGCVQCSMYLPCICKDPATCKICHAQPCKSGCSRVCKKCLTSPCVCAGGTGFNVAKFTALMNQTSNMMVTTFNKMANSVLLQVINKNNFTIPITNIGVNSGTGTTISSQYSAFTINSGNQPTSAAGITGACRQCFKKPDECGCPRCIKCHSLMSMCKCMPALVSSICDGCGYSKPLCHCTPGQALAASKKILQNITNMVAQIASGGAAQQSQPAPKPVLATGPAFYNPSMLDDGTDKDKLARIKAIMYRNQMLGKQAMDLYAPGGLRIRSKRWPGRVYVAYAHHVSLQVYDHGVNIGRLDCHVQEYDVPMGDSHLAIILKAMHDEEGFIKIASFSPVRDI